MNKKNLIILVVIALFVAGIGGYIIFTKNTAPSVSQNIQTPAPSPTLQQTQKTVPQASPTPAPQSGDGVSICKTYGSEEFNFEFTCPDGWHVSTNDLRPQLGQTVYFVSDKSILTNKNGFGDFISGIDFSVEDNSKLLTLQQWINQNIGFEGTSKPIKVAGAEGVRITGVGQISGEEDVMVIFSKGDKVFVFSTGGVYIAALDKILPTFRFLR